MDIEELGQNIHRLLGIVNQIHDENDTLRAENEAMKNEIEKLVAIIRRQEYEMRSASAIRSETEGNAVVVRHSTVQEDKPERMGRILPFDDKHTEPLPLSSSRRGAKKTTL
jgi:hypothetical protein